MNRSQHRKSRTEARTPRAGSDTSLLKDLVRSFQGASQALEKSYGELQDRVRMLTAELEREREQRVGLERLAAMGEMAMELAHEIRNPLGSIELYASMLTGEYADQIVRSVRLLNHSVTNVLAFGRPIVPSPKAISIRTLLEGVLAVVQPLATQKRIQIAAECEAPCTAVADHELLHRMLLNLALNALRETPSGGTIRLTGRVEFRASLPSLVLTVEDSGPGIPQATLTRIFDPMFSTHRDGCGLGLPIVRRIVESHQGDVQVHTSGTGTQFVITLPHNMEVVRESLSSSR